MLEKALEANKVGGDEAVESWYKSLSDAERAQFHQELGKAIGTFAASFSEFQKAITGMVSEFYKSLGVFQDVFAKASAASVTEENTEGVRCWKCKRYSVHMGFCRNASCPEFTFYPPCES